jgi:hypothetical protein
LDPAQVRVLRKLHLYRNEAYHRDTLRSGSLRSAVRIYAYLVCTMMRDLRTQGLMISLSLPEGLRPYAARFGGAGFDLQGRIATEMLSRPEVADSATVGRDLSSHVLDRLDGLLEGLDEAASSLMAPGREAWDRAAILAMVQHKDDARYATTGPVGLRALPVTLDEAGVEVLRQEAEALVLLLVSSSGVRSRRLGR